MKCIMKKSLIASLILALIGIAGLATAEAQSKKSQSQKHREPVLSREVAAVFRMPQGISPTSQQVREIAQLKRQYGPRLENLAWQIRRQQMLGMQAQRMEQFRSAGFMADVAGMNIPGYGLSGRVAQGEQQRRLHMRLIALQQQWQATVNTVRREIDDLLTDEQKETLREREERRRRSDDGTGIIPIR